MKKLLSALAGTLILTLGLFTSCVYIGLFPEKVNRHNQAIKQQLPDFHLDNFSGSFYNIPEYEDMSITFSSKNGEREYLIQTNESVSYFDGTTEKTYTFSTKTEETTTENAEEYRLIDEDIQGILNVVHTYDGTYDEVRGISGSEQYGEEIYDEIQHHVYSMEWKYSAIALFLFYLDRKSVV